MRPLRSKFFQFHVVFGEIWQNVMLAAHTHLPLPPSPRESWHHHLGEILDPPLLTYTDLTWSEPYATGINMILYIVQILKAGCKTVPTQDRKEDPSDTRYEYVRPKSIEEIATQTMWVDAIGIFWRATRRELCSIVWIRAPYKSTHFRC